MDQMPAEMVGNILKYADHNLVVVLRKQNSRIDQIAKNYEHGVRVPVYELKIRDIPPFFFEIKFGRYTCLSGEQYLRARLNFVDNQASYQENLLKIFRKTRVTYIVVLDCANPVLDMQYRIFENDRLSFKNVVVLEIWAHFPKEKCKCQLENDWTQVQRFLPSFPKLRVVKFKEDRYGNRCYIKVLRNKKWQTLEMKTLAMEPTLCVDYSVETIVDVNPLFWKQDADFLHRLVWVCREVKLEADRSNTTGFNITDLILFIKCFEQDQRASNEENWDFGFVALGAITSREAIYFLKMVQGTISTPEYIYEEDRSHVKVQVAFERKPEVVLIFMLVDA